MDRGLLKQHLLLAEKHIGEGVVHVERQRQIVEGLERDGQDVGRSADLLELFEETLRTHIDERDRLVALPNVFKRRCARRKLGHAVSRREPLIRFPPFLVLFPPFLVFLCPVRHRQNLLTT